jgi:hypothetical protein
VDLVEGAFGFVVFATNAYLAYRLNRLTERQNEILDRQTPAVTVAEGGAPMAAASPLSKASRYWPLAAMLGLTILTWSAIGFDYYDRHYRGPTTAAAFYKSSGYVGKQPPKKVWRKEVVPLDGYNYENCEFYDVTFEYEGMSPIFFSYNKTYGFDLKSINPSIGAWTVFLKDVGALNTDFHLILPPGSKTDIPYEPAR